MKKRLILLITILGMVMMNSTANTIQCKTSSFVSQKSKETVKATCNLSDDVQDENTKEQSFDLIPNIIDGELLKSVEDNLQRESHKEISVQFAKTGGRDPTIKIKRVATDSKILHIEFVIVRNKLPDII